MSVKKCCLFPTRFFAASDPGLHCFHRPLLCIYSLPCLFVKLKPIWLPVGVSKTFLKNGEHCKPWPISLFWSGLTVCAGRSVLCDIWSGFTVCEGLSEGLLLSQRTTKPTIRLVRSAKTQISLRIRAVWSESSLIACAFYIFRAIQGGIKENPCRIWWQYRLIWVFDYHKDLIVGFVVRWLIVFTCTLNVWKPRLFTIVILNFEQDTFEWVEPCKTPD